MDRWEPGYQVARPVVTISVAIARLKRPNSGSQSNHRSAHVTLVLPKLVELCSHPSLPHHDYSSLFFAICSSIGFSFVVLVDGVTAGLIWALSYPSIFRTWVLCRSILASVDRLGYCWHYTHAACLEDIRFFGLAILSLNALVNNNYLSLS
jgi:hypothetical protein